MIFIGNSNYHYCRRTVLLSPLAHGSRETKKGHTYMTNAIIRAAAPAILAIAAILLSFRSLTADTLIAGYFCVLGLGVILATDYRVSWRRLNGR